MMSAAERPVWGTVNHDLAVYSSLSSISEKPEPTAVILGSQYKGVVDPGIRGW